MAADLPLTVKFGTAGMAGIMGWCCVHPFNTLAVRMNLITGFCVGSGSCRLPAYTLAELGTAHTRETGCTFHMSAAPIVPRNLREASMQPGFVSMNFFQFAAKNVSEKGFFSLYNGLSAGITRQLFYATSRFGLFEVFRDQIAQHRTVGVPERIVAGLASGACAALVSCPAEVSLVRMSNDSQLPVEARRNYKSVIDCAIRIGREEGFAAYFRGSAPFVNRAMLVGVTQVGSFDQFKQMYDESFGLKRGTYPNVFAASMSSGLLYSTITMPLESAKNRMAFQKPDAQGVLPYRTTLQTMRTVAAKEGILTLWSGFLPYYGRCGGHSVTMFVFVDLLRDLYSARVAKNTPVA